VIDNIRCEVFNASYEPLSIVSGRRALVLTIKGKATVISEHPTFVISTTDGIYPIPTRVVLKEMVRARPTTNIPAQLTQRNLFIRDRWTCAYCNRHRSELKSHEFLTRDHVIPQSKGGKDEWKNVVTSCNKCNNKKADIVLRDTDMKLANPPHVPTVFEVWSKSRSYKLRNN
jgi:5-methylcytosine-specific restriction endonuclease McrA